MRISLARLLAGVWRVDQAVASVVAKLDALEISGPDDPRDSTRVRESRQVLERLNDEAAKINRWLLETAQQLEGAPSGSQHRQRQEEVGDGQRQQRAVDPVEDPTVAG